MFVLVYIFNAINDINAIYVIWNKKVYILINKERINYMGTTTTTGTKAIWGKDESGKSVIVGNVPVTTTYTTTTGGNTLVTQTTQYGTVTTELMREGSSGSGAVTGTLGGGVIMQTSSEAQTPVFTEQIAQSLVQQSQYQPQSYTMGYAPQSYGIGYAPKDTNVFTVQKAQAIIAKRNIEEANQTKIERQIIISELDARGTRFSPAVITNAVAPFPSYVYGKITGKTEYTQLDKPYRFVGEGVSYMFYSKQDLGYAKGAVAQYYLEQGKSEQYAYQRADIAYGQGFFGQKGSFKRDVMKEFSYDVAIGVGSNVIGAGAVGLVSKGLKIAKASPKIVYYGSRIVGMSPAGAFEGIAFRKNRVEMVRQEKMSTSDYVVSGLVGAGSSVGAQIWIEQGFKPLILKTPNLPVRQTAGAEIREALLYTTDPLEPVSDKLTFLTGEAGRNIKIRTFPMSFSNTFTDIKQNGLVYESYVLGSNNKPAKFSFVFGRSQSQTQNNRALITYNFPIVRTNTFPTTFERTEILPRNIPNTLPQPRTTPFPNMNTFPITKTNINTLPDNFVNTRPNVFPNVNTLPSVLPETKPTPFPNTFVGDGFPFVPPMRGDGFGGWGFGTKTKQKKAYIPSLTAISLGIKAKKGRKIDVASGLSVRPII